MIQGKQTGRPRKDWAKEISRSEPFTGVMIASSRFYGQQPS
jgi:hypothetical protein